MIYQHEQVGRLLQFVLASIAAVCLVLFWFAGDNPLLGLVASILVITMGVFQRLRIRVDASGVRWGMTLGWPGGFVATADIESAEIIPVSFWYGIGIHLTLRGWVWNVALGRGVQIARRGKLPLVLGTDDPKGLLDAIERARAA